MTKQKRHPHGRRLKLALIVLHLLYVGSIACLGLRLMRDEHVSDYNFSVIAEFLMSLKGPSN